MGSVQPALADEVKQFAFNIQFSYKTIRTKVDTNAIMPNKSETNKQFL